MTSVHHTPHAYHADLTSAEVNRPLGELDAAIETVITTGSGASTTLTAQALSGQASLTVASSAGFVVGDPIYIGTGALFESRIIATVPNATTITVTVNLSNVYAAGKPVSKSPVEIVAARGTFTTLGARIAGIESRVFDVRTYGTVARDGVTDDWATCQAAITAAGAAGGGIVEFPPGTYRCSAPLVLPSNVILRGSGRGSTIKVDHTGYGVSATGTLGTLSLLTANLAVGGKVVTIASTAGYAAEDLVWLQAEDDALSYVGHKKGELAVVATVDSATQLTLMGSALDAYATASTAKIGKVTPVRDVGIHDLRLTSSYYDAAPTTPTSGLVLMDFVMNATVRGCILERNNSSGVVVRNSLDVMVAGCSIDHMRNDDAVPILGYGVSVAGGSRNVTVTGNVIHHVRHAITTGTAAFGPTPNYGVQRGVTITGNTVSDTTHAGIDTHEDSDGVSITGNTVVAAAQVGIQVRCWNTVVSGNSVSGARGMGIYASGTSKHVVISGNVVRNTALSDTATNGWGIRTDADNVTISGNRVTRSAAHGISITSSHTTDVAITGNSVSDNGQAATGDGINVGGSCARLSIVGNIVVDEQTVKTQRYGLRFEAGYVNAGSDVIVTGNILTPNATSAYSNAGTGKFRTSGNGGLDAPGHRFEVRQTTGSIPASTQSDITVTFPYAFADTDYTVVAAVQGVNLNTLEVQSVAVGSCVIRVENRDAGSARTGVLHVSVIHD